jgi:hypothetical protein
MFRSPSGKPEHMHFDPVLFRDKWYGLVAMFLLLPLATEVGYLIGRRKSPGCSAEFRALTGATESALLALVGLLLGFSFMMASSRYDLRKQLVTKEANSIETTYLRAGLLPTADAEPVRSLLREYVGTRVRLPELYEDYTAIKAGLDESSRIQDQLWDRASAAARSDRYAITNYLFIDSLNEMIDLQDERLSALENRLPTFVVVMLFGVTSASLGVTGFSKGLGERRGIFLTVMLTSILATVLFVILDLERPRGGFINISQHEMYALRARIGTHP